LIKINPVKFKLLNSKSFIFVLIFLSLSLPIYTQQKPKEVREEITPGVLESPPSVWSITHYGFLKADYVQANHAVLSYGRENLISPSTVKRVLQADDSAERGNNQLADSRYGIRAKYGEKSTGVFEFDMVNFDMSSPNVNTRPRLRQAYLSHIFGSHWEVFAGQKWDLFSPLNPESYNIVGSLFNNGNVGWMREQIGTTYRATKELHLSVSMGNGKENTSQYPDAAQELNKTQAINAQIKYMPTPTNVIFLSAITYSRGYIDPDYDSVAGRALLNDGSSSYYPITAQYGKSNRVYRSADGVSLGHEYKAQDGRIRIRWEANAGQNLGDIRSLGLSAANLSTPTRQFSSSRYGFLELPDFGYTASGTSYSKNSLAEYENSRTEVVSIHERSGWVSFVFKMTPEIEIGLIGGASKIVNPKDLVSTGAINTFPNNAQEYINPVNVVTSAGTFNPGSIPGALGGSYSSGSSYNGKVRESSDIAYHFTYIIGPLRLFFQHDYMRTFYADPERTKGIGAYVKSYNPNTGAIVWNTVDGTANTLIKTPHYMIASAEATAHVVRLGAMLSF